MTNVREVVIEILRHGKPHNQLLSPTTRYLGLCGRHPAEPLTIPIEHHKVIHLLSRMIDETRATKHQYERLELRDLVTDLLNQLPALPSEASAAHDTLIHLRLVTTAQELSLLPFELAHPPAGVAQSSQPLLMGPQPSVLLTREVRRSAAPANKLPPSFRVLLVTSDPYDRGLPREQTLAAFEEILAPYAPPAQLESNGDVVPDFSRLITVLGDASLDEVRELCHRETYSHVHFLAHGAEIEGRVDAFGIALWDRYKKDGEVIDGEDLARALTPPREDGAWPVPWCVTLATCESASQMNVLVPQTSLAHALHEVGIPTVIASQYPLTFGAAVEMTHSLYEGELRGDDIRFTLRSMRHRIGSRMRNTYDWASLATYAAWPADLDAQSRDQRRLRTLQELEAANKWVDAAIALLEIQNRRLRKKAERAGQQAMQRLRVVVPRVEDEVERAREAPRELEAQLQARRAHWVDLQNSEHELAGLKAVANARWVEFCGLLGAAFKRRAHLHHLLERGRHSEAMREALCKSGSWYAKGADRESEQRAHWTACQAFIMQALCLHFEQSSMRQKATKNWQLAKESAERELPLGGMNEIWAHSTLVEVELWRSFFSKRKGNPGRHVNKLIELAGATSFPVLATRRQLRRYSEWWLQAETIDEGVASQAGKMLQLFPSEPPGELPTIQHGSLLEHVEATTALEPDQRLGADRVVTVDLDGKEKTKETDSFFRVQMLPARGGDALWIEYGRGDEVYRVLIDGGYRKTIQGIARRIRTIARETGGVCRFDLVVVTHVDTDHIEGIIELLGSDLPIEIGELWYNGRRHHPVPPPKTRSADEKTMAGKHGLFLDTAIAKRGPYWNGVFDEQAIVVPAGGELPQIELPGGMTITLLSPTTQKLKELAGEWDQSVKKAGLQGKTAAEVLAKMRDLHYETVAVEEERQLGKKKRPPKTVNMRKLLAVDDSADKGEENGASIAFVAEFDGRSVLLAGDAHADVLIDSIKRLPKAMQQRNGRLRVGAVKLAHHGSKNNVSKALLEHIDTQTFLVSTNGGGHFHPDQEAIARVVGGRWRGTPTARKRRPIRLLFNYLSDYNKVWNKSGLKSTYAYETHYPGEADVLELSPIPETPSLRGRARKQVAKKRGR